MNSADVNDKSVWITGVVEAAGDCWEEGDAEIFLLQLVPSHSGLETGVDVWLDCRVEVSY